MALGIPLPGQPGEAFLTGLNSGSSMWSRMMQPKLQREQMAQQQAQHAENLALHKQQLERLQSMDPYQQQLWQAQAKKAMADAQQAQMIQQMLGGLGAMQQLPTPQQDMTGGMPPFMLPSMQPSSQSQTMGQSLQQPQYSPLQAQLLKALTGIDLFAESPEMKSQRAQRDFEAREQYKFNQPKSALTTTAQNQAQEELMRIDKLLPDLKTLQMMPPQKVTFLGSAADKNYEEMLFNLADSLVKAKSLPQTDSSIKKQLEVLRIGVKESPEAYIKRLQKLEHELLERRNKNLEFLQKGSVSGQPNVLTLTDKDL